VQGGSGVFAFGRAGSKHVFGDLEHDGHAWGLAGNVLMTNGRVAVANVYVPPSAALTADQCWVVDLDVGAQRTETPDWHALVGAALELEIAPSWHVIGEMLRNGSRVRTVQVGLRFTVVKDLDVDLVAGGTHDLGIERWLTLGLNIGL